MTPIEDNRLGPWENKMLKEFKPIKVAKAKKRLRNDGDEGAGGNLSEEEQEDVASPEAIVEETNVGTGAAA